MEAQTPLNVVITGAAGQIAYSIIFMIANGDLAGKDQLINLVLLDIPVAETALKGVEMEIVDCAFPLVNSVTCTVDYAVAFKDADVCLLIGARPRGPGMVRADLLKANAPIFSGQGKAIDQYAKKTVKVLVVGNPANTNALITMTNAPSIPRKNFTAMTRLDQNRSAGQISKKCSVSLKDVTKIAVWGNHSATMFSDISFGEVKGKPVYPDMVEEEWFKGEFLETIQKRGKSVIDARGGKSSAASAAKAAVDHVREWLLGTPEGTWSSMGVVTDGNTYGIPEDLIFSFPCICKDGEWKIVDGLKHGEYSQDKINTTKEELVTEKAALKDVL